MEKDGKEREKKFMKLIIMMNRMSIQNLKGNIYMDKNGTE